MSTASPPPPPTEPGDGPGGPAQQQPAEPQQGFSLPQQGAPAPGPEQSHPAPGYQQPGSGHPQQQYGQQQHAQQQYGPPSGGSGGRLSPSEERTWSILAHLSAPIAFVLSAGFLSFVGPLIIWAIYKDRSPMVRNASAGAFNFNLTTWLVYVVGAVIGLVLTLLTFGLALFVFIPLAIVVFVVAAVLHIVGAVKASNGEPYTYPMQLPVLK